ncbi:MAG TPA: nicotinate-nucleotide adenylyltransferase [Solirubrobacteraceae bacterium]|nr:nicotinate-nucleotide adenylyltransferase [Solirubrobacteraceae bacterium]
MAGLGILGGTFNPPHVAHLLCASEARWQLGLERVLLVPAGLPPHKQMTDEPGIEHRLEMCRIAAAPHGDWLEVSEIEARRPGPSYTVDTLREINASRPGDELTFIVGGDMAWSLPAWREPEAILELAAVAVAERAGARREEIRERLRGLRGAGKLAYIEVPRMDISSAALRRRVRAGEPITYLVPDGVSDYIDERRLYQRDIRAAG